LSGSKFSPWKQLGVNLLDMEAQRRPADGTNYTTMNGGKIDT
jgi:hypothetical protein